jgi:hypothetical protein
METVMGRFGGSVAIAVGILLAVSMPLWAQTVNLGRVTVYAPEEVTGFCSEDGGRTFVSFPGTRQWALEAKWDGFHPMPLSEVIAAIEAIDFPAEAMTMHILILPVPRQDLPRSSAEGNVVFLSPGAVSYPIEHVHYTLTHEIGHVVHNLLMPDTRQDLWGRYASLREVSTTGGQHSTGHAWSLHEMFAEDFRFLFGGDLARCGGGIENHEIAHPGEVVGLREFLLSLVDEWMGRKGVVAYPNPFRTSVVLSGLAGGEPVEFKDVAIMDVRGRIVRRMNPCELGGCEVVWDGANEDGQPAAPGLYVITARTNHSVHTWKVVRAAP